MMKFESRLLKTAVVSPETGRLVRASINLDFPILDREEAPVALKLGNTEFRTVDGRLIERLEVERYASPDWAIQCNVNYMLSPYLTEDQNRTLVNRTRGNLAGPNITDTEIGTILRAAAARHPIIDGVQYVPSPGPVLTVESDIPLYGGRPQTFKLGWASYGPVFSGCVFTWDQIDAASRFSESLERESDNPLPTADSLAAKLTVLEAIPPPSLREFLLWNFAVRELSFAANTPIHHLGRDGVIATRALAQDIERRRDKSVVNQLAHDREGYLRRFDIDGIGDLLGPVVDARAESTVNQGEASWYYEARFCQSTLEMLAPDYRRQPSNPFEDEELTAALRAMSVGNGAGTYPGAR